MKLKMNLLENAYDFLNSSLYYFQFVEETNSAWKIALINIIQSMELMFKECLRRTHEVLIFENIDRRKNTVSLSLALDRMINIVKLPLDSNDKYKILKAIDLRNQMMHYEIECPVQELNSIYTLLFEFLTSFHIKYLDGELHSKIDPDYWEIEASIMEFFRNEFVLYNGVEVLKTFPKEILEAQVYSHYRIGNEDYLRVRYGEEKGWFEVNPSFADTPCHDCAATKGMFHVPSCDVEECPKCGEQALSCDCDHEE